MESISHSLSHGRAKYPDKNLMDPVSTPPRVLKHYKVHILVLLIAFLAALTIAHPAFLLTDEWITGNQLNQINVGHQITLNEGKYGSFENGTPGQYFILRQNYLWYSLLLPFASLPAEWLVYLMGENFVFFIVYLEIFLLIGVYLLICTYFSTHTKIGKWRWTEGLLVLAFILFLINLYFYVPFPIIGTIGRPEIEAIVFTNCILFALIAVFVYDVLRQIFDDPLYAFFGVIVCLTNSSYLFWSSFCKDHVLIAFLFAVVTWMLVRFWKMHDCRYLFGAFTLAGLLAWARPELALFVFASLCVFVLYLLFRKNMIVPENNRLTLLLAPLFTALGAIPFLLNNYVITGNPFTLSMTVGITPPASAAGITSSVLTTGTTTISTGAASGPLTTLMVTGQVQNLLEIFQSRLIIQPTTFLQDLYGVLFHPQSGSLAVFPLVPLFFISLFLMPTLIFVTKIRFTPEEKQVLGIMGLLSLGVFVAYIQCINLMNGDLGIVPDIRYLSPLYLPLDIIGLLLLQKTGILSGKTSAALKGMVAVWLVAIPLTLIIMSRVYPVADTWAVLFPTLDIWIAVTVFTLATLFLISYWGTIFFRIPYQVPFGLLVLLISVPLLWQIDATFLARLYGTGLGGYTFWTPVVRVIFGGIF